MTFAKKSMNPLTLVLLLSGVFFLIFIVISAALFFSSGSKRGGGSAPSLFGQGSVAVVELNGVIQDSKKILTRLERYEEDAEVKAVVLRLNSPGGSVAPSQEIHQAVKNYKKPVVVSMGSVAASGAYYIACAAKKVFANPGTITGSIGVIMEFANLEKLYDWAKVRRYAIKTGKFKDSGAEYREMTAEERALLQSMVDDVLVQFKRAVVDGRKLTMAQVTAVADGRIFSGNQAKAEKLVDDLGSLQDAINEAAKMAKIKGKPKVVYPEKSRSRLRDFILDDQPSDEDAQSPVSGGLLGKLVHEVFGLATNVQDSQLVSMNPGLYWLWTGAH